MVVTLIRGIFPRKGFLVGYLPIRIGCATNINHQETTCLNHPFGQSIAGLHQGRFSSGARPQIISMTELGSFENADEMREFAMSAASIDSGQPPARVWCACVLPYVLETRGRKTGGQDAWH